MDYIHFSISNPVKVTVGVMLVVLMGVIAVWSIPVQLVPNVDQPVITVTTAWVGRSPEDVEKSIVKEQEEKLKGVSNLRKMTATASQGEAQLSLEFFIGSNMSQAIQEVSDKLREVPSYPADVDQPVITVADAASENAIAWMVLQADDPELDVVEFYHDLDLQVKPYLERVDGLSRVNIFGGRDRQVHIRIDPRRLAERGITFNQLSGALRLENVNVSAGDLKDGRLDVRIRTVGQYDNLEDVRRTIVADTPGGPVRVADLGDVELTLEKTRSFVRSKGQPALAMNCIRASGSNVMSVMNGVRQRLDEINRKILPDIAAKYAQRKGLAQAPKLALEQVYDETVYVQDAIVLVRDNLWQGGVLTVIVLLLFLRSLKRPLLALPALAAAIGGAIAAFLAPNDAVYHTGLFCVAAGVIVVMLDSAPTLIISLSIPISIVGTFVVMAAFGRNLNVVSLAGLAFAVGMVVDNAIVVLENTDRHLGMGKHPRQAAYDAAKEVWLAILASTATTLVVFLPVLTLKEEAGQLFADISLAIMASVGLSLIVAVTVIPAAAARWLHPERQNKDALHRAFQSLFGLATPLAWLRDGVARLVYWCTAATPTGVVARLGIVGAFTVASLVGSYFLMPPTTYLPKGNRNLVFGIMFTPPAYNIDQNLIIGKHIEEHIRPYWLAQTPAQAAQLPPAVNFMTGQVRPAPPIENFFFVSFNGTNFMGAASRDKANVEPLGDLLTASMQGIPGSFGVAQQMSLFGNSLGGANAIDVEIAGDDLERLRNGADALFRRLTASYGYVRSQPGNFSLTGPELQVKIDRVRAADLGVDNAALGLGVAALVDGVILGDYRDGGDTIDLLLLRDPQVALSPEILEQTPIAYRTRNGAVGTIPLASVARLEYTTAPQQIQRIEQRRAVTLSVYPPPGVPLQSAMEGINQLRDQLVASGEITPDLSVNLAGTADKLTQVREAMLGRWHGWNLQSLMSLIQSRMFLALLVDYLVMAALFESFLYPWVIMFSVPLAIVGGFAGLRLLHTFDSSQLLDVVTMLGFVILFGTVVNNAILLVAQALNFMQGFGESEADRLEKKMSPREAIRESVRTRLRPVLMTTLTTVFGMLPLVIKPGSGSELYRGLGAVVLAGLLVSTIFTLLVVPLVFSLTLDVKVAVYRRRGWPVRELGELPDIVTQTTIAAK